MKLNNILCIILITSAAYASGVFKRITVHNATNEQLKLYKKGHVTCPDPATDPTPSPTQYEYSLAPGEKRELFVTELRQTGHFAQPLCTYTHEEALIKRERPNDIETTEYDAIVDLSQAKGGETLKIKKENKLIKADLK